jgi:hypothetical protein
MNYNYKGLIMYLHFNQWRYANDCEREAWGEPRLPEREAFALFQQLKESGWLTNPTEQQSAEGHAKIEKH